MAKKKTAANNDPDKTWFIKDPRKLTTSKQKNDQLSSLLLDVWNPLLIVSIRRLEIGVQGWEATYRA